MLVAHLLLHSSDRNLGIDDIAATTDTYNRLEYALRQN